MNNIVENSVYNEVSRGIVVQKRYSALQPIIEELFSSSPGLSNRTLSEIGNTLDSVLVELESAIALGNYDYISPKTGEMVKGSFQQIPEAEVKSKLIIPIMKSIFTSCIVSTEDKMDDYKVDASIYPNNSKSPSLDKDFKLECKRLMHGVHGESTVCLTKSHIEETYFKLLKTPGLSFQNNSYRITGGAGKQVITGAFNGKDTLSSQGICAFTNGLYFTVSINYNDWFTSNELKEFELSIPILRENAFQNNGVAFTGAFDYTNYPLFVFPIKVFDENTGKYCVNSHDLNIFYNMLNGFMNNTTEWDKFLYRVHSWYIDELRKYVNS